MATLQERTVPALYARAERAFAHWEKTKDLVDEMIDLALNYRQSGHPGGSRSKVHMLLSLMLSGAMRWDVLQPWRPFADRFVLSAGHTVPLVYATLAVLNEAMRARRASDGDPAFAFPFDGRFALTARMGTAAVDPLVDMLADEGPDVVRMVGQLLRDLTGPQPFVERLASMDPEDRRRAVEALGAIGGEAGLDGLARALSDPVERIRVRAVTLLGQSRDPRAFEAVKRTFLSDPVEEVVAAAEEALQKLQPGVQPGEA